MFPALIPIIGPVLDKLIGLIPNQQEREKARLNAELELAKLDQDTLKTLLSIDSKQIDVNVEEAKSANLFVSGARPFILWVCGVAFAYTYIVQPICMFVLATRGNTIVLPTVDLSSMMPVLLGLLGLGGMRTYEKLHNVQGNH